MEILLHPEEVANFIPIGATNLDLKMDLFCRSPLRA